MDGELSEIAQKYVDNPDFKAEVDEVLRVKSLKPVKKKIRFRKNRRKRLERLQKLTVCSAMFCYNDAEVSNDPSHPPFCEDCKAHTKKKSRQK